MHGWSRCTAVKSGPKAKSSSKVTALSKDAASPEAATTATKKTTTKSPSAKKAEAGAEKPKTRRRTKPETRTRIYWAVFNQSLKRVAVFEFDQKGEAEKRAVKLSDNSGDQHFIQKIKATVQV